MAHADYSYAVCSSDYADVAAHEVREATVQVYSQGDQAAPLLLLYPLLCYR
jgi:hypothetical protein